uniref:C2H2-type domain-containing protein n=1 Tax=Cacopsylla melanoneura TaxID=428564 RepID=A0A8D9A7S6_9HEMI
MKPNRSAPDLSVSKKSPEENEFETFIAESNEVSPLSMNTQVNQIVAFDNARHEQENQVLNKDAKHTAQTTGLKLYEAKIDQLVMKDDRVDIKIVDKYQLARKKKSTDPKHGSQKKSRNYSYDENDLKSHKKLLELVEMQKQLQNQAGSKQFDESHKHERSADYNNSGSESNEIKQEPWSIQTIKQEEKTFNEPSLNEKLPMNLSMKTDHLKHASVVENETHAFETNGPNGFINETVVKNHSLSLPTTKKTSKIQHDGNKPFSKVVEENSLVSKAVDKSCKDDVTSENDLIREDPVCIYCYKKLPKDISNIIEHCRLCVYMLRPINIKYMCYMCLYNTHCRTGIKRHIMRHLNIRPYTCSICPFSGIVSRSLKLHMKTHTMEQLISLSDSERKNNSVESSEFADDFEHDPNMTGETRTQSENMRHLEAMLDAPMNNMGMLNETLREPMLAVNTEHDAVNDSNNNTSLGNDKLEVNMNKTASNAIDLTNNNNLSNSSEGTIINEKMSMSHSLYANSVSNFAFEELSLKGSSFSNCLGFDTQSQSENGALDFCIKKSS